MVSNSSLLIIHTAPLSAQYKLYNVRYNYTHKYQYAATKHVTVRLLARSRTEGRYPASCGNSH
jgi:hypothetical protein